MLTRRRLLETGLTAATAASFGPAFWRNAFAAPPSKLAPVGPYGPLQAPDANGIMLPPGFSSRMIARSGQPVAGTGFVFPAAPDGAAAFPVDADGGWILAVNTEVAAVGGASAIRFDAAGNITKAYRILEGTSINCAGGPTPWAAWLSCEEHARGMVWECDIFAKTLPVAHAAMGVFQHEACCVDPVHQQVYLSEDVGDGGLYRYTPTTYPDLSAGLLEIACPGPGSSVVWKTVPDPLFVGGVACKDQVPERIQFARGEGIWFDSGLVYLATTTDETIHVYDTNTNTLDILYRAANLPGTPLKGIDNVHVTKSGDLLIAEDSYDNDPDTMDVCLITRANEVSRFLKMTGPAQANSEVTGIAFAQNGQRMYIGSQRYGTTGAVFEITGPFRSDQATVYKEPPAPVAPKPSAPAPTPGVPIGLDIAKRISEKTFIRRGLVVGFTLGKPAAVRIRVTAKIGNKTKTLATLSRNARTGRSMLRITASKSGAKLLKGRRRDVKATVEIRITTPGAPVRTIKRSVTLRS